MRAIPPTLLLAILASEIRENIEKDLRPAIENAERKVVEMPCQRWFCRALDWLPISQDWLTAVQAIDKDRIIQLGIQSLDLRVTLQSEHHYDGRMPRGHNGI